ncbi:MAG: hypothetical protein ACK56I_24655, partial [bacterium]
MLTKLRVKNLHNFSSESTFFAEIPTKATFSLSKTVFLFTKSYLSILYVTQGSGSLKQVKKSKESQYFSLLLTQGSDSRESLSPLHFCSHKVKILENPNLPPFCSQKVKILENSNLPPFCSHKAKSLEHPHL